MIVTGVRTRTALFALLIHAPALIVKDSSAHIIRVCLHNPSSEGSDAADVISLVFRDTFIVRLYSDLFY